MGVNLVEKGEDLDFPARGLPAGGSGEATGDCGRAETFSGKKRSGTSRRPEYLSSSSLVNRRMRTRMSGGVRGRGLTVSSYSISVAV